MGSKIKVLSNEKEEVMGYFMAKCSQNMSTGTQTGCLKIKKQCQFFPDMDLMY